MCACAASRRLRSDLFAESPSPLGLHYRSVREIKGNMNRFLVGINRSRGERNRSHEDRHTAVSSFSPPLPPYLLPPYLLPPSSSSHVLLLLNPVSPSSSSSSTTSLRLLLPPLPRLIAILLIFSSFYCLFLLFLLFFLLFLLLFFILSISPALNCLSPR